MVTVVKPLDYETDKTLQVIAVAVDNGQPQLTSTATININIINVNDENPTFGKVSQWDWIYDRRSCSILFYVVLCCSMLFYVQKL